MSAFNSEPALSQQWILEATWSDCPVDVSDEISDLWVIVEYGNDDYYFYWKEDEKWWYDDEEKDLTYAERWPAIARYLKEHSITECLIHYWW